MSRALSRPHFEEMIDGEFADLEPFQAPKPQIIDVQVREPSPARRFFERYAEIFVLFPGMALGIGAMVLCMGAAIHLLPMLDSGTAMLIGYAASLIPALLIGNAMRDILAPIWKRRQGLRLRPVSGPSASR